MKKSEKIKLYIYKKKYLNFDSPDNSSEQYEAFAAPDDKFMGKIFEKYNPEEGSSTSSAGDFESFWFHRSGSSMTTWDLIETLEISKERLESTGIDFKLYKKCVKEIEEIGIDDYDLLVGGQDNPFEIPYFEQKYVKVIFDL